MLKDIGEILIELGILKAEQVSEYSIQANQANQSLIAFLLENKILTELQVAKYYATQLNLPLIEKIKEDMIDSDLIGRVPFKFLRENVIIPLKINQEVTIVTADPNAYQAIDEVTMLLNIACNLAIATSTAIVDAINRYYPLAVEETRQMIEDLDEQAASEENIEFSNLEDKDIMTMAQEAPIIKLVNQILFQAIKLDASDIHIEPEEKNIRVRFRIDGVLHQTFMPPKRIQSALVSRIKIMADLNIAEKRIPLDGRINIKVASKSIDLRVSTLPTSFGENVVMRILDKTKTFNSVERLGFSKHDLAIVLDAIAQPNGILLMSGPTGSGKTSTLYSLISRINTPEVSIVTVEDPVEYQLNGISQVQVNDKVGLTFAKALRSILRQDPNIIMIGETRDHETAQIAIQASLTGHLVLSTIHTNSAPATITRLIDMGIEPFLIASSITCVIAQRLVRKLHDCKALYNPDPAILQRLGISANEAKEIKFYAPKGCADCANTGYKGRLAIFEVMKMNNEIAKLTIEKVSTHLIEQAAKKAGMTLLVQDGIQKIKLGLTTIEEVLSVATNNQE
jgi:general secretion pathway protein E